MSITPPYSTISAHSNTAIHRADRDKTGLHAAVRPAFGVRIADIAAMLSDGTIVIGQRKIPTLPQFDQAFGAFAQGTLFQSDSGFIAVEDLHPGDRVLTSDGRTEVVNWIGSATFSPSDQGARMALTRIMADSFGVNRPDSFLSLGSGARVLQTPAHLRGLSDTQKMMTPAKQFIDGVNVIEVTPPTPVRLFHVGLRTHSPLIAGGMEVESYHPGPQALHMLSHTLRSVFLGLFPHVQQISDFGTMSYPRAPDDDSLSAA